MKLLAIVLALTFSISLGLAQDLNLTIKPFADSRYKGKITAVFRNDGKKPIKLLKLLDGSEWRWHKPYYDFSVFDSTGQPMKLGGRCGLSGLWSETKWPDDYLITLNPGTNWETSLDLPFEIPQAGEYKVTLSYIYDSTPDVKALGKPYPEDLWLGVVKSNLIAIPLEKR